MSRVFYYGTRSDLSEQISRVEGMKAKCLINRPRLGLRQGEGYFWGGSVAGSVLAAKVIFTDAFGSEGYPDSVAEIYGQQVLLAFREDHWCLARDVLLEWCQDFVIVALPVLEQRMHELVFEPDGINRN